MARQPIDPSPESLVDAIVQTSFAAMAVLNTIGADNDLSLTQLRVLGILRDRRLRMTELADYLGLEKSTMSGLVDRAERRGLLARAPSADDGRAVDVFLTDAGVELGERLYAQVAHSVSRSTDALSDAEQATLKDLLSRMLASPVRN
ncbi:MarR family winged helix-turn-helix transcriptional regulator [Leifsonia poae]|uniref:MarR family winged helix-turn-helix transcriptional regulator n=1 Tax=Leifsonia poae TaxID=110933 RepID=UPI003D67DF42